MIDIELWMHEFTIKTKNLFLDRLCFVGLQGSMSRGDATEESDIDVVVIVDNLDFEDLKNYYEMLDTLTNRKKICGFISGKEELQHWDKGDLFQFFYDTTPYYKNMADIIPKPNKDDAISVIKLTAGNLLHVATHNYLHGQHPGTLAGLYKMALYLLRAKLFVDTGKFYRSNAELKINLVKDDLVVFMIAEKLKNAKEMSIQEFADYEIIMFEWASDIVKKYN